MLGGRTRDHDDRWRRNLVALAAVIFLIGPGRIAANTVESISWNHDPSGRTIIVVDCAEPVEPSLVRSYPIPDPARAVIVIGGITKPVEPDSMTINDLQISRLRLAHHDEVSPPELLVILDLENDAVEILDLRLEGVRISAVVGVRSGSDVSTPTPLPTRTPSATETPPPTWTPPPSPTSPPTTTPSPTLTPSPTPTRSANPRSPPAPTSTPSFPDRPAPPILPPAARTSATAAPPTVAVPADPVAFASPTPGAKTGSATRVVDIAASSRSDGSTLLRITADGRLPKGGARVLEIDDDPPRVIVTIRSISAPDLPRTISVSDPNLSGIRLIHDAETSEGELHLVLQLTRTGISVAEMEQVGPHLVVLLIPTDPNPGNP